MALYFEAANIAKRVTARKGSIKSLVFGSNCQNKKALYALVCQSLKYGEMLRDLVQRCGLLKLEKSLQNDEQLAAILLYEHLLGKGVSGRFKDCFKKHKSAIHAQGELVKIKHRVSDLKQLCNDISSGEGVQLPKYVRVNTLLTSTPQVIEKFTNDGLQHITCGKETFYEIVSALDGTNFTTDPHIPNLLVFPPSTDFHKDPLYLKGKIILQDKASCFPAYILSPPEGASVIDCCAAPGNKTSHLASIMNNQGTVYAFDKDKKRLSTLEHLVQKAGATCIQAKCKDFLSVDPTNPQYEDVQYILVDPSCSGSGMVNRLNQHTDEGESGSKERLEKLSKFQISILKHALSFPHVKRVVYSTCSIHEEENEKVVEEVISQVCERFEMKNIMHDWPFRGVKGYEHAQSCVRMSHDQALTNGFFVACFEEKGQCSFLQDKSRTQKDKSLINGQTESVHEAESKISERKKRKIECNVSIVVERDKKKKRKLQQKNSSEQVIKTKHKNVCKKKKKKSKERW